MDTTEHIRDLQVTGNTPPVAPSLYEGLIDSFLASHDARQNSKTTYRQGLTQFFSWLTAEGIQAPAREDILRFRESLTTRGLSAFTVSGYLVAVRTFFAWAEGMKIYPNVGRGIKGGKRAKGFRRDCLTVAQVKELLSGIPRDTVEGKRNFALLNLMIRTGLRTVEIIRADVGDIRQEGGEAVLWIQGKGRDHKDEFVVLTQDTLKPLNDYLSARGHAKDDEALFASLSDRNHGGRLTTRTIRGIVKAHLKGIGLVSGRLSAHSLRHTAITLSLQAGATIQEAQALGRHANITTTLTYAHNLNRITHAPERRIDDLLARVN